MVLAKRKALKLHGYSRSGAAYRVRIALNLKGLGVEHIAHHLRRGEQRAFAYAIASDIHPFRT